MKVSINWLKELVDLNISSEELIKLLPLRTIGLKEVTSDYVELDMKGYNRADLLSLRGIAYETAAITDSKLKFNEEDNFLWQNSDLPKADVVVENNNLAPLYCIAKIENLNVEQSPDIWVTKLRNSGIRTVNNIADITNLIMAEFGQPMHAFDEKKVHGSIRVRTAEKGEKITTLDGKIRDLTTEDLLIADDSQPLGIAGIMGGKDSEISNQTTAIFLEAAIFNPRTLRKTATKLGLISEAGKRFYHGLTKKRLFQALDAAIKMYQGIGGKLTALTVIDNYTDKVITIDLTQAKVNSLIGIDITAEQIEQSLQKLKFILRSHSSSGKLIWQVTPPYFRLDIEIEEDLIEEVARMYGYEKIPAKPLADSNSTLIKNPIFDLVEDFKQAFSKAGLTEVQTYSYYSTQVIENCKLIIENLIKVANPISSETQYLRTDLWPNLLEAVAKNIRNSLKQAAIFEIGKVYSVQNSQPQEQYRLSLALADNSSNPLQKLYQVFQAAQQYLKPPMRFTLKQETKGEYEKKFFHPNRYSSICLKDVNVGRIAEVHPRIVNQFGVEQRIAVLEIDLTKLLSHQY